MKKLLILAALAAASPGQPGQPALARPAPANPTVVVQHQDLDLRTEAGARTLQHRIRHAVATVCGTASDFDIEGKNEVRQCRKDTRILATAQAELVIAGATRDPAIRISSIR